MMQIIPTYEVIVDPDGDARQLYRVPQTNLDAFLHVLVFNNVRDFRVMREET